MKFNSLTFSGFLMLVGFGVQAQAGDLYYDHFSRDTIWLETFQTGVDATEHRDFILSGKNMSEVAKQKLSRHFRERWLSDAYQQEIKADAEKMKAIYLESYEQKKATHVELTDRSFFPRSYTKSILTLQENTSYRTNWRYETMRLNRLFYFNVKTGEIQRERELLTHTDTVRLRQLMKTRYYAETQKLPEGLEKYADPYFKEQAENYFYDQYYGEEDTLYTFRLDSAIQRGFPHFSFKDAKLWWTGAGLMITVDHSFFIEKPLRGFSFQVFIPYGKIKDIFKPEAAYAFAENLRLSETRISDFRYYWPSRELFYFDEGDFLRMPDSDKEELYVVRGEAGEGGDTLYRLHYHNQKLEKVDHSFNSGGEAGITTYRWEAGQVVEVNQKRIRQSQDSDTTMLFERYAYDAHNNLSDVWKFEDGRYQFYHWMYTGQSVVGINYSPIGGDPETSAYFFTKDSICINSYYQSEYLCGSYYATNTGLASLRYPKVVQGTSYLYNEDMQPRQELGRNRYILYSYDDEGRLKDKKRYVDNKLSSGLWLEYTGKEKFPSKITTISANHAGQHVYRLVKPD